MVDQGFVHGMILTRRKSSPCDACHVGKQRRQRRNKKKEHDITGLNQVVYADLLFPSRNNGTKYTAILVIMDGYSRYLTAHLLAKKDAETVNELMKNYVNWAERQAGQSIKKIVHRSWHIMEGHRTLPVKIILTDKGGEFVNHDIDAWYNARGIQHVQVGPKSSQMNPVERQHQSLSDMTKAMLRDSGFSPQLWPDAFEYAVYLKNRIYNKAANCTPYERMFGVKPDLHHIRVFGALAYVHVPKGPDRPRHKDNATIGFVLGLRDDQVGYKIYFPHEHTRKWAADVAIDESIVYHNEATGVDASVTGDATYEFLGTEAADGDGMVDGDDGDYDVDSIVDGDYGGSARDIRRDDMDSAYHDDDAVSGDSNTDVDGAAEDQDSLDTRSDDLESIGTPSYVSVSTFEADVSVEDTLQDLSNKKSGEQIASEESETRKRQRYSDVPSNGDVSSHMNEDNTAMCRRRASLREAAKRHKPNRMPRSTRDAGRSKYADFWHEAQREEMDAMQLKNVLEEIPTADIPPEAKAIKTMWVWALKTDQYGYVIRFKARLVALGNWQRPGIDFGETFSPVARMSSFRMTLALAAELNLKVYSGDINTAYLNATLKIPQYVKSIDGFPCRRQEHMYVDTDGTIVLVLVYVDDILCATNNEAVKVDLFGKLALQYGIKDQGELTEYLGVEVQSSQDAIKISQRKYSREILQKFHFEQAHAVGNPLETKQNLMCAEEKDDIDKTFDYRGAVKLKKVILEKVAGVDNPADLFTKALDKKRLARLSKLMGVQKEDVRDGYLERRVGIS
ncbi:unnamed protein product [Peronospora effusa]|nr:unnamed protein product [Peronospora effusa]